MEEVGELATALHDNRPPATAAIPGGKKRPISPEERANLEEEFADVLAWLATLANITGVDLERALAKYTVEGRVEGTKEFRASIRLLLQNATDYRLTTRRSPSLPHPSWPLSSSL